MTSYGESQMNTSTGDNDVENVESSVPRVAKRKRETSFVWTHMSKVEVDGVRMAKCNFCGKLLNVSQGLGTSSLIKHVQKCSYKSCKIFISIKTLPINLKNNNN